MHGFELFELVTEHALAKLVARQRVEFFVRVAVNGDVKSFVDRCALHSGAIGGVLPLAARFFDLRFLESTLLTKVCGFREFRVAALDNLLVQVIDTKERLLLVTLLDRLLDPLEVMLIGARLSGDRGNLAEHLKSGPVWPFRGE